MEPVQLSRAFFLSSVKAERAALCLGSTCRCPACQREIHATSAFPAAMLQRGAKSQSGAKCKRTDILKLSPPTEI